MKFLHDKRRAGILALLTALLGAAFFFGIGAANAAPASPCHDGPWPIPDFQITTGTGPFSTYAGTDIFTNGPFGPNGAWVCFSPTGGEPEQSFVVATADAGDPTSGPAGATVMAGHCSPAPVGPPGGWACNYIAGPTGATVDPTTSANQPYDSTTGTGGSVGAGSGTCVYVNGSPTPECQPGFEVAGLTVNEGDAAVGYAYKLDGGWVTVGGVDVVQLPYGAGVEVGRGTNSSADTVDGSVAGVDVTADVGGCYVGYNTDSDTCS